MHSRTLRNRLGALLSLTGAAAQSPHHPCRTLIDGKGGVSAIR